MALDQSIIENHLNVLNNAVAGTSDAQNAINSYYDYLISENVEYASLAKQVAQNSGDFGQFANDILTANNFGGSINNVKLALAVIDASSRNDNLEDNGNGILSARQIADYHYGVYGANSIPNSAWGGAFFEEFVGTGSWIDIGTTGSLLGTSLTPALSLLASDTVFDQPDVNGVDIGESVNYMLNAIDYNDGDQVGFIINISSSGFLQASMETGNAALVTIAATLNLIVETVEAFNSFTSFVSSNLEIANNGIITWVTNTIEPSKGGLTDLAQAVIALDDDTFNVETTSGMTNYTIQEGTSGDDTFTLAANENIIADGDVGTDTLSYENATEAVDIDMLAGNTVLVSAPNELKDIFDNIENITGSAHNDVIIGDEQANILDGGDGDDVIEGSQGNDTIIASAGNDTLDGGEGNDRYVIDLDAIGSGNNITIEDSDGIFEIEFMGGGLSASMFNVWATNVEGIVCVEGAELGDEGCPFPHRELSNTVINSIEGVEGFYEYLDYNSVYAIEIFGNINSAYSDLTYYKNQASAISLDASAKQINLSGINTYLSLGFYSGVDDFAYNLVANGNLSIDTQNHIWSFDFSSFVSNDMDETGTNNADALSGAEGNDTLNGAGGNDTLWGNDGNDSLLGGSGSDTLWGGNDNDTLNGQGGNDSLVGENGNDSLLGANGHDTLKGGSGADTLAGGNHNDALYGQGGNDSMLGQSGNDYLHGGGGHNTLRGGDGDDIFFVGTGNDLLYGDAGNDEIYGNSGADTLYGGDGNDSMNGENGADSVYGEAGDDALFGGNGTDTIVGGDGNDIINGEGDSDNINGNAGNDFMVGDTGNDTIRGEAGDDGVYGGLGNDRLFGGGNNDWLEGGDGVDWLHGGTGSDGLTGGADRDYFYYTNVNQSQLWQGDWIYDFQSGVDKLHIKKFVTNVTLIGDNNFSGNGDAELRQYDAGGNTVVHIDTNGDTTAEFEIVLVGGVTLLSGDII